MIREPCVSTVKVLSYRVPTNCACGMELLKVSIFGSKLLLFLTMIFSRPQYKLISQSYELLVGVVLGVLFDVESDSFIKSQIIDLSRTRDMNFQPLKHFWRYFSSRNQNGSVLVLRRDIFTIVGSLEPQRSL